MQNANYFKTININDKPTARLIKNNKNWGKLKLFASEKKEEISLEILLQICK